MLASAVTLPTILAVMEDLPPASPLASEAGGAGCSLSLPPPPPIPLSLPPFSPPLLQICIACVATRGLAGCMSLPAERVCACVCACVHTHISTQAHTHAHTHTRTHTHTERESTHACTYAHVPSHMCRCWEISQRGGAGGKAEGPRGRPELADKKRSQARAARGPGCTYVCIWRCIMHVWAFTECMDLCIERGREDVLIFAQYRG